MPQTSRFFSIIAALVMCLSSAIAASAEPASLDGDVWTIAPQGDITGTGEQISKVGYQSGTWVKAQVPGTVFASYVTAGLEPEPTYGDNIDRVDRKKYDRNFWYRRVFTTPTDYQGGTVWLHLDGVNRDADVYLNGNLLGSMQGFMQRGCFDITALTAPGRNNALAVLDHVPVTGEKGNFSSPSFICSGGWDWMPGVPGLNMGIYKSVYLRHTDLVTLHDPWIRTTLPDLPKTDHAELTIQAEVTNHGSIPVKGQLVGEINPGKITFVRDISLKSNEVRTVKLDPSIIPALRITNPKLWWPNGYGKPDLYTCHLEFRTGTIVSDHQDLNFGIRQVTYTTVDKTLRLHVNGTQLFVKGGNWGMAEFMLRCHGKDFDTRLRLHQEMNLNLIRNWMGMTADPAFYDACDRFGIMVWDEFWLNAGGGMPSDPQTFRANTIEKIKQVRNHPSVVMWCGANEAVPPEPLNGWLESDIATYDGGDRQYHPSSNSGNLSGSGPWRNLSPRTYFSGAATGGGEYVPFGMRSELGTATFTSFDSFKKFMPESSWWPPRNGNENNKMWNTHFFGDRAINAGPAVYHEDLMRRYGTPGTIQEYCLKAQLLNLETMQALYEGWLNRSDRDAAGVIIWMSQSAYPSMVWQTYDYYYDTTGAYWGAKKACEPVHIYWNRKDDRIRVVNTSPQNLNDLTAEVSILNMDGAVQYTNSATVSSPYATTVDCFSLTYPKLLDPTHFIKLQLKDRKGTVISDNFYWRGVRHLDYKSLNNMKPVTLSIKTESATANGFDTVTATITNPLDSHTIALAIRTKLVRPGTGEQILPVFANDGYFSLIPGESKRITMQVEHALVGQGIPQLVVECYNNQPKNQPAVEDDNLAGGKTVTASSCEGGDHTLEALVDGDTDTRWASQQGVDAQWISIDLGQPTVVKHVKLIWESACASSYALQVSNDAETWTTMYETTDGKGGLEELPGLHGEGRYVRLLCRKRATDFGYSLFEMEVHGQAARQ